MRPEILVPEKIHSVQSEFWGHSILMSYTNYCSHLLNLLYLIVCSTLPSLSLVKFFLLCLHNLSSSALN